MVHGLENRIFQINLSQKKCFDKKKQTKGIFMTDCILIQRQQEKKWFYFLEGLGYKGGKINAPSELKLHYRELFISMVSYPVEVRLK